MKKHLTLKKINLTENARKVLEVRYLKKNDKGEVIEEPEDLFYRVAENIASAEKDSQKWTEIFYNIMSNLEFLPNSPTLMNAGRDLQQLSACFVLPIGDSMEEIFEAVKNTALIHKSGGGTGFSFSRLRPKNDRVKTTKGVSSGPISFMKVFDVATEAVKQGGTRRGANMGLLRCDHPDILDFISIKEKDGILSNFNISIAITDEFMKALKNDKEYSLYNPRDGKVTSTLKASEVFGKIVSCAWKNGEPGVIFVDKINKKNPTPHIGEIESTNPCLSGDTLIAVADGRTTVSIKQLAEEEKDVPVYSIDENKNIVVKMGRSPRITRRNQQLYKITLDDGTTYRATNNHEFMLLSGEMRRLDSLKCNDSLMIKQIKEQTSDNYKIASIEKDTIEDVYCLTVDDTHKVCITSETKPTNFILASNCGEQPLLPNESCNLGSINVLTVVGESGIDYSKLENITRVAVRFLDNVIDLNKYPLPAIEKMTKSNRKIGLGIMGFADLLIKLKIPYNSKEALNTAEKIMSFVQEKGRDESSKLAKERGVFPNFKGSIYDGVLDVRNATITTIAPTGTLSMIAGCSSGIEPLFSLVYEKNVLDGRKFLEIHPEFLKVAKEENFYSEELMKTIMKNGSILNIKEIPESTRNIFVTTHDIDFKTHVDIQATFQKYTDNAVSKTINFKHDTTVEEVESAYRLAYELNCKGVTVYRDGSRENQVMTVGTSAKTNKIIARDIKLPTIFNNGPTRIIKKEGKKFYIHFSYLPEDKKNECPIVLWIHTNAKYKSDELKVCNKAARKLYKLALSSGIDEKFVKETVEKANADYPHNRLGRMVSLCLRHNVPREDILVTLMNIDGDNISTLLTAVRRFLTESLPKVFDLKGIKCPECGADLIMQEGCQHCSIPKCSWSACP